MSNQLKNAREFFNTSAAKYEVSIGGSTRELARHVLEICPQFHPGSSIHDNACGTGIITQEILQKVPTSTEPPLTIACTDVAPAMIDLARDIIKVNPGSTALSFEVMSGESLTFPDEHFTHSITNLGILFFPNPLKGAQEILRTLKPGGTAIVTSWANLGYIDAIHQAQKVIRPNDELIRMPIPEEWYQASHLEKTLREAGFNDVKVHEKKVHYAAKTVGDICNLLAELLARFSLDWSEEEGIKFREHFNKAVEKAVVKIERLVPWGSPGEVEALVGIPMTALVAVARK